MWFSGWSENYRSSLPAAPGGRTPRGSRGLAQPITWTGCHMETGPFSQRQPGPRARPVSLAHNLKLRAEAQALGPSAPRRWRSRAPERVLPLFSGPRVDVHSWRHGTPGHPRAPHPHPLLAHSSPGPPPTHLLGGRHFRFCFQGLSSSQHPSVTSRLTCDCSSQEGEQGSCNKGLIFSIYNELF